MNQAESILQALESQGVQINVIGNTLRIEADRGTITPEMRECLKENKPSIISLIKTKKLCEESEISEISPLPSLSSLNSQDKNKKQTGMLRALGYGCGSCGNKVYSAVMAWEAHKLPETESFEFEHRRINAWQCENCNSTYSIIGGSRGPQYIH